MSATEDTLYVEVYTFYMKTLANCLLVGNNGAVIVDQRGISALIRATSLPFGSPTAQQMPLERTVSSTQLRSWAI
jgi:hypothetical protein